MNENGNAGGSKKKKKLLSLDQTIPPPNPSLISNFFFLATNTNSQLNVGHVSIFEENDDEGIILHRRNKRVNVEDEEEALGEVKGIGEVKVVDDDEGIILHRRNKRVIVEDEEEALGEVKVIGECLATDEVKANVVKKYKYAHTYFFKLIESFYSKPVNKSVPISKEIIRISYELLSNEYPDLTKSQAKSIIKTCAAKCRGCIRLYTGKKSSLHPSNQKITNAENNPRNNPKNSPKNNLKNNTILFIFTGQNIAITKKEKEEKN